MKLDEIKNMIIVTDYYYHLCMPCGIRIRITITGVVEKNRNVVIMSKFDEKGTY